MSKLELDSSTIGREEKRLFVRRLPDDEKRLFCTWAIAHRIIHLGTDYFGRRLNWQERQVWQNILVAKEREMVMRYSGDREKTEYWFEKMWDKGYLEAFEDEYQNLAT